MTIDEIKNKISMDLGGKYTQLGFEVICKKLTEFEKENAESKQILYKLVNAFNDYECAGTEQEQENTWEILRDLMHEELFKLTTRNK